MARHKFRIPALLITATLMISLCGCNNSNDKGKPESTEIPSYTVGDITSVRGNIIDIKGAHDDLRIEICEDSLLRVRIKDNSSEFAPNENNIVQKYEWDLIDFKVEDNDGYITIKTGKLLARVNKETFAIEYYEPDGLTLITKNTDEKPYALAVNGGYTLNFEMDASIEEEGFYGLGVNGHSFNFKGKEQRMWLSDKNRHYLSPFFMSSRGYGIYVHSTWDGRFNFKETPYSIKMEGGELDYYFMYGPSFKEVISAYSLITGRLSMPNIKTLGLMYRGKLDNNATQYKQIVDSFRENNIPLDYIGLEPGWQTGTYPCTYEWSKLFPDPKLFVEEMSNRNVNLNVWQHPYVSSKSPIRSEIEQYLFDHKSDFAKGNGGLAIDFTSKEAGDIYWSIQKKNLADIGIFDFKIDEVDEFITSSAVLPGGMTGAEYHNIFGTLNIKLLAEKIKSEYNLRNFSYCRGLTAGAQRYPSSGYTDTYDLAEYVRFNVNAGFTGGYVAPELRGDNEASLVLYNRRVQLMFFSAYALDNEWQNGTLPWQRKQAELENFRKYAELRMRLIPYIYSAFREQNETGIAVLRPLMLEFQDDKATYSIDDQYMFGSNILVAPVTTAMRTAKRNIYLPAGCGWIDFFTGEKYDGGQTVTLRYEDDVMPLFIKEGAVIPTWETKQYIEPGKVQDVTFEVYLSDNKSEYRLYEDDGETFDYENGEYSETFIKAEKNTSIYLEISKSGAYDTGSRRIDFELKNIDKHYDVYINGSKLNELSSADEYASAESGCYYDSENKVIYAK